MPALVRKILVVAAVDGLILEPLRQQKPLPPIRIKYASHDISTVPEGDFKGSATLEAHGVIGLLKVSSSSYLIALTGREPVAQIRGKSIYTVTGVSLIPLASQTEAQRAIDQTVQAAISKQKAKPVGLSNAEESENEGVLSGNVTAEEDFAETHSPVRPSEVSAKSTGKPNDTSIAQDVIRHKGAYGRFAERWFSKKGWAADRRRVSMNVKDKPSEVPRSPDEIAPNGKAKAATSDATVDSNAVDEDAAAPSLLPKLLRTTKLLLTSRSFFFSYDHDLTRRVGYDTGFNTDVPLHKRVDPLYFWNRHLSAALINTGQHSYVLPLMQGFVGQKAFTVDLTPKDSKDSIADVKEDVGEIIELQETTSKEDNSSPRLGSRDFLVTLISRRSVERAGLRYLRRGVDEDGFVANAVETEQILSDAAWSSTFGIHSFTQIRGSIPLFFTQSPYSFKPVPTLQHSFPVNHRAFKKHFQRLRDRYGVVQAVSLVEKRGQESSVGEAYSEHTQKLNDELSENQSKISYEWFDFHKICAGMKFEKVSILMDMLRSTLDSYGFTVEKGSRIEHRQGGVLRTNCMDCLDRTNVVQSAAGAWALEAQLGAADIDLDLETDTSTQWFNSLWADNGDAISKQYSSTSALKGDFTRTRKRDYRGAINDFGLTLTRYYNNIVNDYFSQTTIDFLLGTVTDAAFEEFEDNMMTTDPGVSMRTIRENAVDTSAKITIADPREELVGGWTVATPHTPNTLRTLPLREIVLLLTDAALYAVCFDWNTEKVLSFERIALSSIVRARRGVYVTSTFTAAQRDPRRNCGLVLTYRSDAPANLVRTNTRSRSTLAVPNFATGSDIMADDVAPPPDAPAADPQPPATTESAAARPPPVPLTGPLDSNAPMKLLALKALPARTSRSPHRDGGGFNGGSSDGTALRGMESASEREVMVDIGAQLARAMGRAEAELVEEGDIIDLAEAKRSTGLLETLGHEIKRMVWA